MKFLGWLKGRGWLMVGLVSTALAGAPGCGGTGKKKVDQTDARNTLYGIWMDTVDEDEFAPVYGIWGDVTEDIRPPDLDGRVVDAMEQKDDPMDAAVYGIWDVGEEEPDVAPEMATLYGIFVDDVGAETEVDAEEPPNVDLYGVWLDDVKEP